MTKKEIRQKYCDKRNYTSWNKYNITEYSKYLENELIKVQKQVKKLTIPDVVGQSEQLCDNYVPYFHIGKYGWEVKCCKNCKKNISTIAYNVFIYGQCCANKELTF